MRRAAGALNHTDVCHRRLVFQQLDALIDQPLSVSS